MRRRIIYTAVYFVWAEGSAPAAGEGSSGLVLRPVTTSSASANAAPTAVHANAAANLSSQQSPPATVDVAEAARADAAMASAGQMLRYNSFEFVYRQDIGRIVLIGQSPETGERVVQLPSEQVLQAYERTKRVERQAQVQGSEATTPAPSTTPQLAKALVAAVTGDNHGSAVVSVSA